MTEREIFPINNPEDQLWLEGKKSRICFCGFIGYKPDYAKHLLDGSHNKRIEGKKGKKFGIF
jgi:hypothetical protein